MKVNKTLVGLKNIISMISMSMLNVSEGKEEAHVWQGPIHTAEWVLHSVKQRLSGDPIGRDKPVRFVILNTALQLSGATTSVTAVGTVRLCGPSATQGKWEELQQCGQREAHATVFIFWSFLSAALWEERAIETHRIDFLHSSRWICDLVTILSIVPRKMNLHKFCKMEAS